MRYFRAAPVMAFCCFAQCGDADAATATGSFNVRGTIAGTCVVTTTTDLDFGTQGVLATNIDQTSTITITCTKLDKGLNGASTTTRQMKAAGPALINYSLYSDAGRTVNWGDIVGTDTVAATGTGTAQNFTVFGRIPPQASPVPALYTDTITITVTF